jgi:hypothetical protein
MNGLRIALIVLALALDALCLALIAALLFLSHPSDSAKLGMAIIGTVVAGNLPALVWSLLPRRRPDEAALQAGIFS